MQITIDTNGVDDLADDLRKMERELRMMLIEDGLERAAIVLQEKVEARAPAGAKFDYEVKNLEAVVGLTAETWVYRFLESGTEPHIIRAKSGQRLRIETESGEVIYPREVNHPGIQAEPFMGPALEQGATETSEAFFSKVYEGLGRIWTGKAQ